MTPTPSNRDREIECWFHDHEGGEFVVAASDHRSSVVGDSSAARTVIYTTKFHCLDHNLHALDVTHPVMIVGRYGLPVCSDLIHLDALPVDTRCYFLWGSVKRADGTGYDWRIKTTDGRSANFTINDVPYDLNRGGLFAIQLDGNKVIVHQIARDISQLKIDLRQCTAFVNTSPDIVELVTGKGNKQ